MRAPYHARARSLVPRLDGHSGEPGRCGATRFGARLHGLSCGAHFSEEHMPTKKPVALHGRQPTGAPRHLVTMGSPLANLYHRLMPHRFEWLKTARREPQKALGASWDNIYGSGDYVGRSVLFTELLDAEERGVPRNGDPLATGPAVRDQLGHSLEHEQPQPWVGGVREHRLGPLGHTRYWNVLGTSDAITELIAARLADAPSDGAPAE